MPGFLQRGMKSVVHRLLKVSPPRFVLLFLIVAVLVSVIIVLAIDFLWDGRFNAELEFAGVLTPFLDGLLLVVFVTAMLNEIREEATRRKQAEAKIRTLNEELERKVSERTQQLLEVQDELVRKEKLAVLGQIANSVGHEMRNPLGVMNNAVYYLQTVLADAGDTTQEYLGIIQDEIAVADRIVADLLDSVCTRPPHPETSSVRLLVNLALGKYSVPVNIAVDLAVPETLPNVFVDPRQIQQVLRNLIANAIEAMPDGGTLEIRATAADGNDAVAVDIVDSGVGIEPEYLPKLFQPLFTTKARRVGLGLAMVKNLTEVNGGSVAVKSKRGDGTVLTVRLPCVIPEKITTT